MTVCAAQPAASAAGALDSARTAASRGWRPFPVDHPALSTCASAHRDKPCPGKRGKHPVGHWPTMTASPPADGMLRMWFGAEPRNVGIGCKGSGLLVLDEDEQNAVAKAAADRGEDVPATYRVRTSRGWHYYLADPDGEFGNGAGALAEYGIDVRGSRSQYGPHGGYVVGAGSVHASGLVYEPEDPHAPVVPVPAWIAAMLREAAMARPERAVSGRQAADGDEPRRGFPDELRAQYRARLDAVRTPGGEFRHELHNAARDGYRLVDLDLHDEGAMLAELEGRVVAVWGAESNDDDNEHVRTGRELATVSPWALHATRKLTSAASTPGADEPAASAYELEVRHELRRLDVREEAQRRRAERAAARRPSIRSGLIDVRDLDKIEPPRMLMGSLIPELSVGFLAGRSGSYKSFLGVSWACSLAAGRPWLDRPEFIVPAAVRVLYVAAEGAAGIAQRIRAWEHANGELTAGSLSLYPRPVKLNAAAQAAELSDVVAELGIGMVVVDTYHRSAPGTDENSSTEFGLVFEAVAALRDEHRCSTLFLDHTGHAGERLRGASAKGDDADYVLTAGYEGTARVVSVPRTLTVSKLKDLDTEGSWPIRLRLADGAPAPVVEIGEVGSTAGGLKLDARWHELPTTELPERAQAIRGDGRTAAQDVYRLLAHVDDPDGLTLDQITRALAESPRKPSRSTLFAGMALLKGADLVTTGSTPSRWVTVPG